MTTKITSTIKKIVMSVAASACLVSGSYAANMQEIQKDMNQIQTKEKKHLQDIEAQAEKYSQEAQTLISNAESGVEIVRNSKRLLENIKADIEATAKIKSICQKANKVIDMDIHNHITKLSSNTDVEFSDQELVEQEIKLKSKKHEIINNCTRDLGYISKEELVMLEQVQKIYKLALTLEGELNMDKGKANILATVVAGLAEKYKNNNGVE